jgi:hypothetical protein
MGEKTNAQVIIAAHGDVLGGALLPASNATYRKMRKHPTIALARALSIAPIVAADWSVEKRDDDTPDGWVDFISNQLLPIREPLVDSAMEGGTDFGWQPWEKVFDTDSDGLIVLRKLKPLLQDITEILVDRVTGAFEGFRQREAGGFGQAVTLPLENSLLIPFRVEGTDWYGEPLLENARNAWNDWHASNKGARKYDEKVAGSHFVVYYPLGQTEDGTGTLVDNCTLARRILDSLEASGSIAMPATVAAHVEDLAGDNPAWRIEILADGSARQYSFGARLDYLDAQMARAMLIPERSVLQGQHGTQAEAGEHIDLALTHADLTHRHITRMVNWHVVDQLLSINYGQDARGAVRLVAAPIRDAKLSFLREVYVAFLANPSGFLEEYGLVDSEALKGALGIPIAVDNEGDDTKGPIVEGVEANDPRAATARDIFRDNQQEA